MTTIKLITKIKGDTIANVQDNNFPSTPPSLLTWKGNTYFHDTKISNNSGEIIYREVFVGSIYNLNGTVVS